MRCVNDLLDAAGGSSTAEEDEPSSVARSARNDEVLTLCREEATED